MKFLFKVIIVFFIVFSFRLPIVYSSVVLSMLLSAIYYLNKKGRIPFTYFFQRYTAIVLIATVSLAFIIFLITVLHNTDVFTGTQKRIWIQLMMLAALIFALPLLIEGKESSAFEEVAVIICYAYAIQGLIFLAGYLYAPFGDYLFNLKPEDIRAKIDEANIDRFRLYCLSGIVFVELSAAFGIALALIFWLQLKSNHPYISGWRLYVVFFFIFLGTSFAGRTGFIGLLFGLGIWLIVYRDLIFMFFKRNFGYIVAVFFVLLVLYGFVLKPGQRQKFSDEIFPFAFEWYYNFRDYGKFEVKSATAIEDHYFYLYDETLLKGNGQYGDDKFGYSSTDAGYMNILMFGGIPYLIILSIYQSLYFIRPIALTKKNSFNKNDWVDAAFFIALFAYMFIVNIKTIALGSLHVMEVLYIAVGSTYVIQYYVQKEQNEMTE